MSATERTRHRLFLANEFDSAGFLRDDPFNLADTLLDEVVSTILAPDFEGHNSTHGAVILSDDINKYRDQLPANYFEPDDNEPTTPVCDGAHVYSLIVGNTRRGLVIFHLPLIDELDLFTLRDDALYRRAGLDHDDRPSREVFLVKRFENGDMSVFCREGIATHRGARWTFARYQYDYKTIILEKLPRIRDWDNQVVNSILRIFVHVLSPIKGVGATVVLLHKTDRIVDGQADRDGALLNMESALSFPWPANITDRAHQRVLINVMRRTDGAIVVGADGDIRYMRCWLIPPQEDMRKHRSGGGTRHLSAEVFSAHIEGLVFVASASGPISIYGKGERILCTSEINPMSPENLYDEEGAGQ